MIGPYRPKIVEPVALDLVRDDLIVRIADSWDGIVDGLADAKAGVYEIQRRNDGTVGAVATARADGTWRIEGGKRHGR